MNPLLQQLLSREIEKQQMGQAASSIFGLNQNQPSIMEPEMRQFQGALDDTRGLPFNSREMEVREIMDRFRDDQRNALPNIPLFDQQQAMQDMPSPGVDHSFDVDQLRLPLVPGQERTRWVPDEPSIYPVMKTGAGSPGGRFLPYEGGPDDLLLSGGSTPDPVVQSLQAMGLGPSPRTPITDGPVSDDLSTARVPQLPVADAQPSMVDEILAGRDIPPRETGEMGSLPDPFQADASSQDEQSAFAAAIDKLMQPTKHDLQPTRIPQDLDPQNPVRLVPEYIGKATGVLDDGGFGGTLQQGGNLKPPVPEQPPAEMAQAGPIQKSGATRLFESMFGGAGLGGGDVAGRALPPGLDVPFEGPTQSGRPSAEAPAPPQMGQHPYNYADELRQPPTADQRASAASELQAAADRVTNRQVGNSRGRHADAIAQGFTPRTPRSVEDIVAAERNKQPVDAIWALGGRQYPTSPQSSPSISGADELSGRQAFLMGEGGLSGDELIAEAERLGLNPKVYGKYTPGTRLPTKSGGKMTVARGSKTGGPALAHGERGFGPGATIPKDKAGNTIRDPEDVARYQESVSRAADRLGAKRDRMDQRDVNRLLVQTGGKNALLSELQKQEGPVGGQSNDIVSVVRDIDRQMKEMLGPNPTPQDIEQAREVSKMMLGDAMKQMEGQRTADQQSAMMKDPQALAVDFVRNGMTVDEAQKAAQKLTSGAVMPAQKPSFGQAAETATSTLTDNPWMEQAGITESSGPEDVYDSLMQHGGNMSRDELMAIQSWLNSQHAINNDFLSGGWFSDDQKLKAIREFMDSGNFELIASIPGFSEEDEAFRQAGR